MQFKTLLNILFYLFQLSQAYRTDNSRRKASFRRKNPASHHKLEFNLQQSKSLRSHHNTKVSSPNRPSTAIRPKSYHQLFSNLNSRSYYLGIYPSGLTKGIKTTDRKNHKFTHFRLQTKQKICDDGTLITLLKLMSIHSNKFLCLKDKTGSNIVGRSKFDAVLCTWQQGFNSDHKITLSSYNFPKFRLGLKQHGGYIRKPKTVKLFSPSSRWVLTKEHY